MIEYDVKFTSLCRVADGNNDRFGLLRLADIDNGQLFQPFKSNRMTSYFENRTWIYKKDGPSTVGTIGVWQWTSIPNQNNPDTDYVQSYYISNINPVRVVITMAKSLDDLVEQLKLGHIRTLPCVCDTLFAYQEHNGLIMGLFCKSTDFVIVDRYVQINEDIYALPFYSFGSQDIFTCEDGNLCFLKNLQLCDPLDHIIIGDANDIIKSMILERSTWSLFKECVGATKAEWRHSKTLLEKICSDSLYDGVSQKLKCSLDQAKQLVDDFAYRANELIETGDVDIETLARIVMMHDGLRVQCEDAIYQRWQEAHKLEIAKANDEIAIIQSKAIQEEHSAQQRLIEIQHEIALAMAEKEKLHSEIDLSQCRLDELITDIEEHEVLGKETMVAVQKRIENARENMAGFIAEISPFLQQSSTQRSPNDSFSSWRYGDSSEQIYSNDEVEVASNWQDDFDSISQNFSQSLGVNPAISMMLGAFLYSAHLNKIPLLIAGPGSSDVANILSVSIYASNAGILSLGDGLIEDMKVAVQQGEAKVVSIQNMFGSGWSDTFPQLIASDEKHMIWTHPYVEDLLIEPKSLFNYMIPVFSECFTEWLPARDMFPGRHGKIFKPYTSNRTRSLHLKSFRQLGLSKLQLARLEKILSNAKEILNRPNSEKDLEMLFGLLPFSVLFGKKDILKETLENEKGISDAVRTEVARYLGEE